MQHVTPQDAQDQTVIPPQGSSSASGPHPPHEKSEAQPADHQTLFYTQEDDLDLNLPLIDDQENQDGQSSPFVQPFQNSAPVPTIGQVGGVGTQGALGMPPSPPTSGGTQGRSFHLLKILLIVSVVLLTLVGASIFVFAQSSTPVNPTHLTQGKGVQTGAVAGTSPATTSPPTHNAPTHTTTHAPGSTTQTTVSPPPQPTQQPDQGNQGEKGAQGADVASSGEVPSVQLLSQLGWTHMGLSQGDAVEALRTGTTFTDREMSYDYRTLGTPTHHGGTLIGSTFLLTPGGQVRFAHNDVRAINNVLYDKIRNGKMIQQVVKAQPTLVQFQVIQVQGQAHLFAWINVSFQLFQSKLNAASGKRTEGLVQNTTTGQPLIRHMTVVLLRVPPQNQGANAPMGGTGWLVDTYALDANALPAIATNPSL